MSQGVVSDDDLSALEKAADRVMRDPDLTAREFAMLVSAVARAIPILAAEIRRLRAEGV